MRSQGADRIIHHVPWQYPIDRLEWWDHFSLSGGTLAIGGRVLGLVLPRRGGNLTFTSALLIVCVLLNLLCQFLTSIPSWFSNITAAALFLTLAWLGVQAWSRSAPVRGANPSAACKADCCLVSRVSTGRTRLAHAAGTGPGQDDMIKSLQLY